VARGADRARRAEAPACALLLLALAALLYGSHIARGGFAWDDWENAATTLYDGGPRFVGPFDMREALYEPGLGLLLPLPHLLFGTEPAWHLALAALLGVALSLCLFALLRELVLGAPAAMLAALLMLAFPWSDATRLWATAGLNQVAGCLYLAGALLALRSLRETGERGRRLTRASRALYVASLLTYPVAVLIVAGSTLLHRARVPWRAAWRRGRWELGLAVVFSVYQRIATTKPVQPFGDQIDHLGVIADQTLTVLSRAVLPADGLARGWGLALIATICAAAPLLARRRAARGDASGAAALNRWSLTAGAACVAVFGSYAIFATGEPKYVPLADGLYNRVGMFAGAAAAVLVVALAAAVAEALLGGRGGCGRWIAAASATLCAATLAGWSVRVRDDATRWDRATEQADEVLATLHRVLPNPPPGSVIFTTGHARYETAGIPVFSSSFDLRSALRVARRKPAISAYPLGGSLLCERDAATPGRAPYRTIMRAPYGNLFVVDVRGERVAVIRSAAACRRLRAF